MPYMEGVGDEVLISFTVVVVILASLVFWILTEASRSEGQSDSSPAHTTPQSPGAEQRRTPRRELNTNPPQERPPDEAQAESSNHAPSESLPLEAPEENLVSRDSVQNHVSETVCNGENVDLRQMRLDFFNKNSTENAHTASSSKEGTLLNGPVQNNVADSQPVEGGEGASDRDPEVIQIRLKYLDDTERTVQSPPSQIIQQFKRIHFADDLANNRFVRLISTGYVLEDSRTLQSYGLVDNSVIHVQVQTNQVRPQRPSNEAESELDIGQFLSPILGIALLCVWIMHFQYKEYFSTTSTVALLVLSVLFLTVVWGQHGGSRTANTPVQ